MNFGSFSSINCYIVEFFKTYTGTETFMRFLDLISFSLRELSTCRKREKTNTFSVNLESKFTYL